MTCVPCKLLERIVCSNIMAHLDEYKLLSDRQHAFWKGHSCETQLTMVINDLSKILDNRGQVDTFILDFEKAFDTHPHELLKSKLFSYGIGGKTLKWIDSFLCFRQQRIVVNGVKSDWAPVLSSVPQGPVLVSLYINDISSDFESEIRPGFALPIAIVAKCEEKLFLARKNMTWRKQVAKKNSPHKKIATEISPINKLQCTEYLSNNYFNPLIYLPVLLTVSYMYL